jgi:hypothetical protein
MKRASGFAVPEETFIFSFCFSGSKVVTSFSVRMGQKWTSSEDETLRALINAEGKFWTIIASKMPNRNPAQVAARWQKCLDPALIKGSFSVEEDRAIIAFVHEHGIHAWPRITGILPNRSPKQCRERWFMSLDPEVSKEAWTWEEDSLIFQRHLAFGPKWSAIAQGIPGRTANAVKNRWNASVSKRIGTTPDGEPYLMESTARKYTRTKLAQRSRPPPLILPILGLPQAANVSQSTEDGLSAPPNRTLAPSDGSFQESFDPGWCDCDDSLESPLDSRLWSLRSPDLLPRFYI